MDHQDARPTSRSTADPVRTCVGCRVRAPRSSLLRIVAVSGTGGASTRLHPDPGRVLPGRGASLHLDLGCLAAAERRRAFNRALRIEGPVELALVAEHLELAMQS